MMREVSFGGLPCILSEVSLVCARNPMALITSAVEPLAPLFEPAKGGLIEECFKLLVCLNVSTLLLSLFKHLE